MRLATQGSVPGVTQVGKVEAVPQTAAICPLICGDADSALILVTYSPDPGRRPCIAVATVVNRATFAGRSWRN